MSAKIYTNADVHKMLKGLIDPTVVGLNGLGELLPANMKAEVGALKAQFNVMLDKLGPIDQIPAAQEVGWGIERLFDAIARVNELASGLMTKATQLATANNSIQTEFNGMQEKIKTGLLLDKDVVKSSIDTAREEGRKSMLPEIIATRKTTLELCGLPVPDETVLGLPAAEFTPRVELAKGNIAKLGEKGLKLGGKGAAWVTRCAWQTTTEFAGSLELIKDLDLGKGTAATEVEPLLGNDGGASTGGALAPGIC